MPAHPRAVDPDSSKGVSYAVSIVVLIRAGGSSLADLDQWG